MFRDLKSRSFLRSHQTSDLPKYRQLYEGAILHDRADETLLDMIRTQNHVYIEWKTNLQWLMKQDFIKTNSCDFSLGTKIVISSRSSIHLFINLFAFHTIKGTEEFFMQEVALAFPRDSAILEEVNSQ